MSQIIDKINNSEYIYSTNTKWGLKKYSCNVAYYTEEPLGDLYYVICSLLSTNNGYYDKRSLGTLLGFSVADYEKDGKHEVYYDVAEVRMFEDILKNVEEEHLIKINESEHEIVITSLGIISLKNLKHYQFFEGTQDVYEHFMLKSELPTALLMFPFYNDMGIYTTLHTQKQIWPDDSEIENIIYDKANQLIKRLNLLSKDKANIYYADLDEYFDFDTRNTPVKLYRSAGEYIPVVMNGEQVAKKATELVCEPLNELRRENLILECLFQKLWDDKSSILNYTALEPYLDLVNYEDLTKDSRTVWSDKLLLDVIVERADQTCWRNISRHCEVPVLRDNIDKFQDYIDWPIFTERIDNDFLITHFKEYPWDLEVLSRDHSREESVIEKLILIQKETEEDWNWDELEMHLSESFVLAHLDIVKVNLARYTNDTADIRKAILSNTDKRWDWEKIEREFDLSFIHDNISSIGANLTFISLFDRVFVDETWATAFSKNPSFQNVIKEVSKDDGILASAIFNDKNYVWIPSVIDLFVDNGLLSWQSTQYMIGFECNPHLVWDKTFFDKYNSFVSTEDGYKFVSQQICDVNILVENPTFNWNWDTISCNSNLLSDKRLYTIYGEKLNWTLLLENQTNSIFLQSLENIDGMIGDDKNAWSAFSAIASIEYVISKYKDFQFPWDWTVLTERMFQKLKLENLGNKLFVDKWDWNYLSKNVDSEFLNNNLEKFKGYWDWSVVFQRILTSDKRLDITYLDGIAKILTDISGKEKCFAGWHALTIQYSFKELKNLIKATIRKRNYWWDISFFCQHREFDVFRDLEDCRNIIDWDELSKSSSVDNSFKYNPKLKIKQKAWIDDVKSILSDTRNRWNFTLLSRFESLRDELWFISQYKEKIDWEYLSQSSRVFCIPDKQKLNEVIEAFKNYINFKVLSEREDVDIKQIIRIYPKGDYDYNELFKRKVLTATIDIVETKPDYDWDWQMVTSQKSFVPSAKFIYDHIDDDLNWGVLSQQDNQKIWGDETLISTLAKEKSISNAIDWKYVSSLEYFPLSESILELVPVDNLDWKSLSGKKAVIPLLDDYAYYVDWRIVSQNKHLNVGNIEALSRYKEHLDWAIICRRDEFKFSNEILESYSEYIDWDLASSSIDINFSTSFVEKFKDKWNWPVLVKNKAFHNLVDVSKLPFVKQTNIVEFIQHFPHRPKAYHFTHMSNAVKIIKAMKLQSRNYAEGNFSNSAGSNVHRTNKAHRFARFYFMPKSPTQFYNECLGKDKSDLKYYERAYNLGLPKCPMPVFFIFDVEELLMAMPDKCYYSNGNMQKDSARCFKVTEEPNRIKAREIYINSYDTFDERQQEFLVEGEVDFSKLKNVGICCYDSFQAEMLREELKGTQWEDVIEEGPSLFERKNKELFFYDSSDSIRISTDYISPFEFKVSYTEDVPTIVNRNHVIRQRGNNIYMSSMVEIKKDVPFDVYFEVNSPRAGSWLIYKHK